MTLYTTMEENIIKILDVKAETQIGSVFNDLFKIIYQTEQYAKNVVRWNFSGVGFLHPFFLLPLSLYRQTKKNVEIECINDYLRLISFEKPFYIKENINLDNYLSYYTDKSYIPICKFDINQPHIAQMQTIIQNIIEKQCNLSKQLSAPLSYMIGELIANIKEHSKSDYGFIFSQYLARERCLNICISDDGITLLGSYQRKEKFAKLVGNSPAKAIKLANEGISTKGENDERGFGISTTRNMLVQGLEGSFFMMSGNAFFRSIKNRSDEVKELPKELYWNGTIVLLKIPLEVPKDFCLYDYLG